MSRGMWILAALLTVMMIAFIYQTESGNLERPWAECKESMFTQMISGECTPRDGLGGLPLHRMPGDGTPTADDQVDDGVTRDRRG